MSARDVILGAVRAAETTIEPMPKIQIDPDAYRSVDEFEIGLQSVAGQVIRVTNVGAIQAFLDARTDAGEQVVSMVDGLRGNREPGPDPHALEDLDFAIFRGEWGVAENGAVWVRESSLCHRVTPFITEHIGLVLASDRIVADLHQAMERVTLEDAGMGVFIAGPSKTADIEQALVIGAHGACSLTVFVHD